MTAGNIFLLLEFYINNETVEKIGHRKTSGWLSQSSVVGYHSPVAV